ncbi:MAG: ribosome maturation factor RimM [Acidimicrobiales bacterium]
MGRVAKAHGLQGEVTVELWSDLTSRLDAGSELSLADGTRLRVLASRPHQGRHLVFFEGVGDRAGADALRGEVLLAPPGELPGALWVHELVGAEVVTTDGRALGTVEAVEANPASDLLVLSGGHLVPLRFVVGNEPGRSVTVDIPDGLVEL